jgi:hypothetical protein
VKTIWRGHPLIVIRLHEKINIDELRPNFEYSKESISEDGSVITHKIVCDVRGVGYVPDGAHRERRIESASGPWIRWVKIEGTGFETNREKLSKVLSAFGDIETPFETETLTFTDDEPEPDDDDEEKKITISTGKLSVRMIINDAIPQYIPCDGKKLKIYYRGIDKMCTKCYGPGHFRKDCTKDEIHWLEYFELFKETYTGIDQTLYGRWNRLHEMWKKSKPNSSNE